MTKPAPSAPTAANFFLMLRRIFAVIALSTTAAFSQQPTTAPAPIKVLVISGGDNSDHTRLYNLLKANPAYAITEIFEGKLTDSTSVYDRSDLASFDVVFLYDFQTQVSTKGKDEFCKLFERGVGLVAIHDALLSYQEWPDYHRIIGGTYLLDSMKVGDRIIPPSDVGRNRTIDVVITDPNHPVTAGLADFTTYKDELYLKVPTGDDIHVLCTAEGHPLVWTRNEKKSRVVTCMLGHGRPAWDDASFQAILTNAIKWTARRPEN